jgi:hypothetical protein
MQADNVTRYSGYESYVHPVDHQTVVENALYAYDVHHAQLFWAGGAETLFQVVFGDTSTLFILVSGPISGMGTSVLSYSWQAIPDPVRFLNRKVEATQALIAQLNNDYISASRTIAKLQGKTYEVTFRFPLEEAVTEYYDEQGFAIMFDREYGNHVVEWEGAQAKPSADQVLAFARTFGSCQVIHKNGSEIVVSPLD